MVRENTMKTTLLALTAVAVLGLVPAAAGAADIVAVSAAHLVDVRSGKVVDHPLVVIEDGRISSVTSGGSAPAGVRRVDLPGLTLLPGLIDMHVHLTAEPKIGGYNGLLYTDAFWSVVGVPHALATIRAGFTSVRNVGSEDFGDVGLRQAIDDGYIPGPRITAATYAIGATGGHCDETYLPPSLDKKWPSVADGPEGLREKVRWVHKYGAQVIKICATGGVFDHGTSAGGQQLTYEEMKAVVDEAHQLGLRVAAHAHGADGIRDAIRAGVNTIEHASLIDDEGIRLAKEKGAWLSMDIYNTDYTQAEGKKNGVLEENLRKDRELGQAQRDNFRKAVKAGVKMIFGTDAGIYPHGDNARQFRIMVQYGMTPLQAIQAATVTAAEALDKAPDVGTLEPGRYGDLIGVTGDPLADVTVLEHVAFVMKGGQVIKDEAAPAAQGTR
jgi:imidazolonepropionase-like amidohydrolase